MMKRFLFAIMLMLALCLPLYAQNTAVTGTVIDPNGNPYANGTASAILSVPAGQQVPPPVNTMTDATGAFSMSLPAGNYVFTVCAMPVLLGVPTVNVTPKQTCFTTTFPVAIAGANEDVSSVLNAVAAILGPKPGGGGTGGIGGSGTANYFPMFIDSSTLGNSPCSLQFGFVFECLDTFAAGFNNGYAIEKANSASGTSQGFSVSLDAADNAITTVNGATTGSIGVCVAGCGTSGQSVIVQLGNALALFDNQTVVKDYVTIGTGGKFHDAGAIEPTGVQVIGVVTNANAGPNTTANMDVFTGDQVFDARVIPSSMAIQVNGTTLSGTTANFNAVTPAVDSGFVAATWKTDNAVPVSSIITEIAQATASVPGLVQLAKDLGGTFSQPLVVGIQGNPVTFTGVNVGDSICFSTSTTLINCPGGVPVRKVTGTTDTIVGSSGSAQGDRLGEVVYCPGGTSPCGSSNVAVTLPQAGSAGFGNSIAFGIVNNGSGIVTVTPTASTITRNSSGASPAASLTVSGGQSCVIHSDNTNYYADCSASGGNYRTCMIIVGADNGSALANADLGPQGQQCYIANASTVAEVMVTADSGTPNVIPGKNHLGAITNLVSSALATAASGGRACSNVGGTLSIDGSTTCSATLQNTSVAAGDFFGLVSGTAGGVAKRMSIAITFTVN